MSGACSVVCLNLGGEISKLLIIPVIEKMFLHGSRSVVKMPSCREFKLFVECLKRRSCEYNHDSTTKKRTLPPLFVPSKPWPSDIHCSPSSRRNPKITSKSYQIPGRLDSTWANPPRPGIHLEPLSKLPLYAWILQNGAPWAFSAHYELTFINFVCIILY